MSSAADALGPAAAVRPTLDRKTSLSTRLIFLTLLVAGIGYTGYSLVSDISGANSRAATILPYFLLGVALSRSRWMSRPSSFRKTHLTYAQGACAELVAMATIAAADTFGLPVSTTHVLSSGVAGTMAANRSGLQLTTLRNLLMAWVPTLPAAILLSGSLYWLFRQVF